MTLHMLRDDTGDGASTPDHYGLNVGDIVTRSAKGKLWRVTGFWEPTVGKGTFASLEPLVGYTNASHPVDQLTLVQRAGVPS